MQYIVVKIYRKKLKCPPLAASSLLPNFCAFLFVRKKMTKFKSAKVCPYPGLWKLNCVVFSLQCLLFRCFWTERLWNGRRRGRSWRSTGRRTPTSNSDGNSKVSRLFYSLGVWNTFSATYGLYCDIILKLSGRNEAIFQYNYSVNMRLLSFDLPLWTDVIIIKMNEMILIRMQSFGGKFKFCLFTEQKLELDWNFLNLRVEWQYYHWSICLEEPKIL